jgi:hypothetical protein
MPWNGTRLYLGEVAQNGAISEARPIAGGATESIFQPEWSPDGAQVVFVSDRSSWWNLYSLDLTTRATRGTGRHAVHGIRLDARCGRSCGVSRRCAQPSRQHRGT